MTKLRATLAVTAAALTLGAAAAQAATTEASGGGFTRDGHGRSATKTMLTVAAHDATPRDSGTAELRVSKPGTSNTVTKVTLTCVVVSGNTAYASGHDVTNKQYLLKVIDNGEPGRNDRFGMAPAPTTPFSLLPAVLVSNCGATDVATKALTGGNFQVR